MLQLVVARKLQSTALASQFLQLLQQDTFERSSSMNTFFYDPTSQAVETDFLPWLMQQVSLKVAGVKAQRDVVDSALLAAVDSLDREAKQVHKQRREEEERALKRKMEEEAAEEERIRMETKVKLFIHTDISNTPIGPIVLTAKQVSMCVFICLMAQRLVVCTGIVSR